MVILFCRMQRLKGMLVQFYDCNNNVECVEMPGTERRVLLCLNTTHTRPGEVEAYDR